MKKIIFLIVFICSTTFAQKSINNYKYIIVKNQFDFLNKPDKYQTSSLTKFLFNKHGFTVFLEGESLPKDLKANRCLALKARVLDASTMFMTKNKIELRDCDNDVVYTSNEGRSKIKEYKKAYNETIRNAFKSIVALNYQYKPLPLRGGERLNIPPNPQNNNDVNNNNRDNISKRNITFKNEQPRNNTFNNNRVPLLYAVQINNGYRLSNAKRKFVFTLLETNLKDVFIMSEKNGIVYKENNIWIADFYDKNGNKVVKQYDIRAELMSRR